MTGTRSKKKAKPAGKSAKRSRAQRPRVKRWEQAEPPTIDGADFYQVHDNGGRPFTVLIDTNAAGETRVRVFRTRTRPGDLDAYGVALECGVAHYRKAPPRPSELLVTWKAVERVWVPRFANLYFSSRKSLGNTILLQIDRNHDSFTGVKGGSRRPRARERVRRTGYRYAFIGGNICQFDTPDPITAFESPVGNNDVPYPAALSSTEAFFPIDQRRLPRGVTCAAAPGDPAPRSPLWEELYDALYGVNSRKKPEQSRPLQGYREIVKRLY